MNILRKARGSEIPKQAQRVFLSYYGDNATDKDVIISDLLSMDAGVACVVSYLEKPDIIDEEQLRNELLETQLLVIYVTLEMLQAIIPDKLPVYCNIAHELNVPILPILNDDGLFLLYKEKLGSIHCIAKFDNEYRIKLKIQLETFLASEDMVKRIKEKAFSATVFASYRKHELSEVRHFMKVFHDLEGFESISVWYDNFLIAGENFDADIKKEIAKSNVLVLVVTPDLAAEGNYVQKYEYPFAQEIGKSVVPVEVIQTATTKFSELFPGTDLPIPLDNTIVLQKVFYDKLGDSVFSKKMDSERAYLLGIAYLKGIGVEKDFDRAIRLLEVATKDCTTSSIDAAYQLASIYKNGTGIDINFTKALQYFQKAATVCEKILGKEHPETITTYSKIANVYKNKGEYSKALECYEEILSISENIFGKDHQFNTTIYNNMAEIYYSQGIYTKALDWLRKALVIDEKTVGKEHPSIFATYNNIAEVYDSQKEYSEALDWYNRALDGFEKVLGKEHPSTATVYNNIALVYKNQEYYKKALKWYQKALIIYEKILGKEHPYTATTYHNIASIYQSQGKYQEALGLFEKSLTICKKVFGEEHPEVAATYNNIAFVYRDIGDYLKALELFEKALVICEKYLGMENQYTIITHNNIIEVHNTLQLLEIVSKGGKIIYEHNP